MQEVGFSDSIIAQAWKRSGGRCECCQEGHRHGGRCSRPLSRYAKGMDRTTGWDVYRVNTDPAGQNNAASQCIIVCSACFKLTKPSEQPLELETVQEAGLK